MSAMRERLRKHSLLERLGANAFYRLVAPSNSEYSPFERIRYWSRIELVFPNRNLNPYSYYYPQYSLMEQPITMDNKGIKKKL